MIVNCARHVGPRSGPYGGRERAVAGLRALLHRHRSDSGPHPIAGAAGARRMRLLQRRRRQDAARRVRTQRQALGLNGIPKDFEFDQLPEDFDHFEPILEGRRQPHADAGRGGHSHLLQWPGKLHARRRLPPRPSARDGQCLGRLPGSIRSASSPLAALAWRWRNGWQDGAKPFDLGDVDIARMERFQGNKAYLLERSTETLGLLYADHFPYRQKATARGVRRSPFHQHLLNHGAVMGELAGWERANWIARPGQNGRVCIYMETSELL